MNIYLLISGWQGQTLVQTSVGIQDFIELGNENRDMI